MDARPWIQRSALVAALPVIGLAGLTVLALDGPLLAAGGLAPLVVAMGVALTVGAGAAAAERRRDEAVGPVRRAFGDALAVGVGALAAAHLAGLDGWWYPLLAALSWPIFGVAAPRWGGLPGGALGVLGLLVGAGSAAVATVDAPPWTLLAPGWHTWDAWLPWSLTAGLLAAGLGSDHWRRSGSVPGRPAVPWLVAGLAVAASTAIAVALAARFTLERGFAPVPAVDAAIALAALGVVGAVVSGDAIQTGRVPHARILIGMALTAAFVGSGADALGVWWASGLPAAIAGLLGVSAWHATGLENRAPLVLGAALAAVAAVLAWPGVPGSLAGATAAAAIGVVAFWFVATRSTLEAT